MSLGSRLIRDLPRFLGLLDDLRLADGSLVQVVCLERGQREHSGERDLRDEAAAHEQEQPGHFASPDGT
jgi:hypothetical protein